MKCPGQDMQYWNQDAIFEAECPQCHKSVEFYKDDPSRRCHHCGHRFVNPKMDFGCAAYCPFAEQCIGTLPEEFSGAKEALLKDKVAVEVKRMLGRDFHQIGLITRTARYAEQLAADEHCSVAVVLCAAYLNHSPGNGNGSADLARDILTRLQADQEMIDRVCSILSRNQDAHDQDQEYQMLAEATQLSLLETAIKEKADNLEDMHILTRQIVKSETGTRLLQQLLRAAD